VRTLTRIAFAVLILGTAIIVGSTSYSGAASARIGLGSSLAQWRHAYGEDHTTVNLCKSGNFCFGPPVNNAENGLAFRFGELLWEWHVADSYDEEFPTGTSEAHVLAAVRAMLPADTKLGALHSASAGGLGACVIMDGSSRALAAKFGAHDPGGKIGIELSSVNANTGTMYFHPTDVQSALVEALALSPSNGC
jgi:hypothetical protein